MLQDLSSCKVFIIWGLPWISFPQRVHPRKADLLKMLQVSETFGVFLFRGMVFVGDFKKVFFSAE